MALRIPSALLYDGHAIPLVGLGTYPLKGDAARDAVRGAIEIGYRLIDTAAAYGNEDGVGAGIRESGVPREELRVVTKLRGRDQGRGTTRAGLEASLERLGLDHVDGFLIHWPNPSVDRYVETYAEMTELRDEGLVTSVGVSNFKASQLQRVHDEVGEWPTMNQIQLSPLLARTELRAFDAAHGIVTVAWGPLGRREGLPGNPVVAEVAAELGTDEGRTVLRWAVQRGVVVIPKSGDPTRQRVNADLFGFELSEDQLARLDALDLGEARAWDSDTHEEQ